jgi:hypothetical protein
MARPDLHKFRDDLRNVPAPGSNAPPRTLRAADLDDNFTKTTLLPSDQSPPLYELRYTPDGTRLTRLLPQGARSGDLLYWNGERWLVLPAPSSAALRVLTIQGGALAWTATEECE